MVNNKVIKVIILRHNLKPNPLSCYCPFKTKLSVNPSINCQFGKDLAGEELIRIRQIVLDDGCPHLLVMQTATNCTILMTMNKISKQCCRAGDLRSLNWTASLCRNCYYELLLRVRIRLRIFSVQRLEQISLNKKSRLLKKIYNFLNFIFCTY
jgi:hypothetical protein